MGWGGGQSQGWWGPSHQDPVPEVPFSAPPLCIFPHPSSPTCISSFLKM